MIKSYRELIVWQKSMLLVEEIYHLTEKYPKSELYGLTSQTRRAVVSIPSNIAEERRRATRKEYHQFLNIAFGSGAELETQIEIAKRLEFIRKLDFSKVDSLLNEVMRILNKMTSNLQATN